MPRAPLPTARRPAPTSGPDPVDRRATDARGPGARTRRRWPGIVCLAGLAALVLAPASLAAQEEGAREDARPAGEAADERREGPRWWAGLHFGLASPTSDLGKLNDSGPLWVGAVARELAHPFSIRASAAFIPLLEGGLPKSGFTGPFGPETDLLILAAGPSIDLTSEGPNPVDVSGTVCGGVTFWESGGSELTEPFSDTDLTGCVFMDVTVNPSRRWGVTAHFDGFMIAGDLFGRDSNPFSKEFVHGFALGARYRF